MGFPMCKRYLVVVLAIAYLVLAVYSVNFFKRHNSDTPLMVSDVESMPMVAPESTGVVQLDKNSQYYQNLKGIRGRIDRILQALPGSEGADPGVDTAPQDVSHGIGELSDTSKNEFLNCRPTTQVPAVEEKRRDADNRTGSAAVCLYPCGQRKASSVSISDSNLTLHFHCSNFSSMHFLGTNASQARSPVALASFPGSGSTWLRYLVEQASGIFTGSQVCDTALKNVGFLGEGVQTEHVSLVRVGEFPCNVSRKPSTTCAENARRFKKVVVLLRNPYLVILSEYNRMVTRSHVDKLALEHYRTNFTFWNATAFKLMEVWMRSTKAWLETKEVPLKLVVEYSALKRDVSAVVRRILRFLELPIVARKIACIRDPVFSPFRLQSVDQYLRQANPYTRAHSLHLNSNIRRLAGMLEKHNVRYYEWLRL